MGNDSSGEWLQNPNYLLSASPLTMFLSNSLGLPTSLSTSNRNTSSFLWNGIESRFKCLNNPFIAELLRLSIMWSWYIFSWTPIAQKSDAEISFPRVTSTPFLYTLLSLFPAVGKVLGRNGSSSSGIRRPHAIKLFYVSSHLYIPKLNLKKNYLIERSLLHVWEV